MGALGFIRVMWALLFLRSSAGQINHPRDAARYPQTSFGGEQSARGDDRRFSLSHYGGAGYGSPHTAVVLCSVCRGAPERATRQQWLLLLVVRDRQAGRPFCSPYDRRRQCSAVQTADTLLRLPWACLLLGRWDDWAWGMGGTEARAASGSVRRPLLL